MTYEKVFFELATRFIEKQTKDLAHFNMHQFTEKEMQDFFASQEKERKDFYALLDVLKEDAPDD